MIETACLELPIHDKTVNACKTQKIPTTRDADITVVNGDLMDGRVEHLGDAVKLLGQLSAKQGVFFTTGNHEYISGTRQKS